ncbi:MAG: YfiR family protein [Deltaproteobacteria bacterium]|nr:YfiR family protein [Deltaproteobacteria bacterium]
MNQHPRTKFAATFLIIAIMTVSLISEAQVQAKLQAAIFVKLLNYDASLVKDSHSQLKFHIIVDSKTSSGQTALKTEFAVISQQKVANKNIVVVVTPLDTLESAASGDAAHVFYLPDGSSRTTLSTVLTHATQHKIPVLGGNAELAQSGAAVGISIAGGKPLIIINLKQSKAMGMNLSSQLLKLAKVI